MQYSLKQLAVLVLLVSVGMALYASFTRTRSLENENLNLRDQLGYKRNDLYEDSLRLTTTGWTMGGSNQALIGSHLIRVENHDLYALEITFYDGADQKSYSKTVDLNAPIVAITYLPRSTGKFFLVQSASLLNRQTHLEFDVDTHDRLSFNPSGMQGAVTEDCFLHYSFYPPNSTSSPSIFEPTHTPEDLRQLCDKYKIQTTFFRIVPRNDTSK